VKCPFDDRCNCLDDLQDVCHSDGPQVRYNASKPGREFISDGEGGGTLYITEMVRRPGFRPALRTTVVKKQPFVG
jgi:hypothetical protein